MCAGTFPRSLPPPERTLPVGQGTEGVPPLGPSCWGLILGMPYFSGTCSPSVKKAEFVVLPVSTSESGWGRSSCGLLH